MTIREAIAQQHESVKSLSTKEKLAYFWEYYGIKTICLLAAVAVTVAFIVSMATKKEYGFSGVFFGAEAQSSASQYLTDFAAVAQIDEAKYQIDIQISPDIQMDQQITTEIYQYMETFSAMVASQSVDCFAGNRDLVLYYSYLGYAVDLRTVLSPEELSAVSPYLHYIDGQLIDAQENADGGLASAYFPHSDSTKPELMGDPIPVAISLSAATDAFEESYDFHSDAIISICASSTFPENALAFMRYCLGLS